MLFYLITNETFSPNDKFSGWEKIRIRTIFDEFFAEFKFHNLLIPRAYEIRTNFLKLFLYKKDWKLRHIVW